MGGKKERKSKEEEAHLFHGLASLLPWVLLEPFRHVLLDEHVICARFALFLDYMPWSASILASRTQTTRKDDERRMEMEEEGKRRRNVIIIVVGGGRERKKKGTRHSPGLATLALVLDFVLAKEADFVLGATHAKYTRQPFNKTRSNSGMGDNLPPAHLGIVGDVEGRGNGW